MKTMSSSLLILTICILLAFAQNQSTTGTTTTAATTTGTTTTAATTTGTTSTAGTTTGTTSTAGTTTGTTSTAGTTTSMSTQATFPTSYNFNNIANDQVYFLKTDQAYFYASFITSPTNVTISANLCLSDTYDAVVSGSYYAAVGFGSNSMLNSDIVFMVKNGATYTCSDYIGFTYGLTLDTSKSGTNDVTLDSTNTKVTKVADIDKLSGYNACINFVCQKTFSASDTNDFQGYSKWFTNKATEKLPIIGAYGTPKADGTPQKHTTRSVTTLTLQDGAGLSDIAPTYTAPAPGSSSPAPNSSNSSFIKIYAVAIFSLGFLLFG